MGATGRGSSCAETQEYQADWRSSVPRHLPCITLTDGTRLLRLPRRFPRAEKWGLSAFADPRLGAYQAPRVLARDCP